MQKIVCKHFVPFQTGKHTFNASFDCRTLSVKMFYGEDADDIKLEFRTLETVGGPRLPIEVVLVHEETAFFPLPFYLGMVILEPDGLDDEELMGHREKCDCPKCKAIMRRVNAGEIGEYHIFSNVALVENADQLWVTN